MTGTLPPLPDLFGNPILRGIEEIAAPEAISWLPQTAGWYGVGGICLAGVLRLLWRRYRRWLRNRYRREALAQLQQLSEHGQLTPANVNNLLKRAAIVASSRQEVANLSGTAWTTWLTERLASTELATETEVQLGNALYQCASNPNIDSSALAQDARMWLLQHRDDHAPA